MTFGNPRRRLNAWNYIGLIILFLANLLRPLSRHAAAQTQDLVDGAMGLLYGVAIGCMIVGIRRMCRPTDCSR